MNFPEREIDIRIEHPRLAAKRSTIIKAIRALDRAAERFQGGCPKGELSIAILTDEALAQIHDDFLDDPTPTDVITFEGNPMFGTGGEICVSVDTAERFAKKHRHDFSEELTLYILHGWLHLAGYDDLKPELKRWMRRAESRGLSLLRAEKLLDAFSLKKAKQGK